MEKLTATQRKLLLAVIGVVTYIVATVGSYAYFAGGVTGGGLTASLPTPVGAQEEDPSEPRTEQCPLDGEMHTKKAKDAWEQRRPLAIMVENSIDARPQSGLSSADIIYEAVAEGGITRFMAIFYCELPDTQVGPVRSARTYFLDWVSPYNALYAHVGGANTPGPANALGQIGQYEIKALNQFGIGFPTFWRDYERMGRPVATEHTMYTSTYKLWEVAEKREWGPTDDEGNRWDESFTNWKFAKSAGNSGTVTNINVEHWTGYKDFNVNWQFDPTTKTYKRVNGGQPHTDMNNNTQLAPTNVVVQVQTEGRANDGYENNAHLIYGTKGQGKAYIFQNGNVIQGQWIKPTRISREKFVDSTGKEIEFLPGQIWIETIPVGSAVTY